MPASNVASSAADVLYEVHDGIAVMTLNRPAARNALTFAMYERIADICQAIEPWSDERPGAIGALIVTGSGQKAFAAGTDIAQFRAFTTPQQALAYERRMDEVLTTIERCPIPTIAAMAGACTGGGAAIALACDVRLATSDMQFGVPIARTLGNCLSCASLSRMSRLVGAGRTMEVMLMARLIGATEAKDIGLVSDVMSDHGALMARATDVARTLLGHAPVTLRSTKEAMRRLRIDGAAASDEDLIEACYMSHDFREGMEAFLAKRPPRWTGR